jgi:hypothetical protein
MYSNTMGYNMNYDAGAMIVPTNEAVEYWWNNEGRDLKDEYKQLDSVPTNTIATLLGVKETSVSTLLARARRQLLEEIRQQREREKR